MNETDIAANTGAVAPFNHRPDTIDAAPLLERIETVLRQRGMSATAFGRKALRDPRLVFDLRRGRRVTRKTAKRLRALLAEGC